MDGSIEHLIQRLWSGEGRTLGKEARKETFDHAGGRVVVAKDFVGLGQEERVRRAKELLERSEVAVPDLREKVGVETRN
jgi:hypothetical protein